MDKSTLTDFIKDLQIKNAQLQQDLRNMFHDKLVLEFERDNLQQELDRLKNENQ
jgi:hypothetical protein